MNKHKLLIINPGSTSTKVAVFEDENIIFEDILRHSVEELKNFNKMYDQMSFRKEIILRSLYENYIEIDDIDCVVGRGGLLMPIESGTYEVNELMLEHLKIGYMGEHASNLGGLLAHELVKDTNCKSYIVDPVVVDELQDVARISGLREIERISIFHALNQKAIAKRHAKLINKKYEELSLIVVHLGGGVSVGAHKNGRVIVGDLVKLCYSGKYTYDEVKKMITGEGGLVSYLGTNSAQEASKRVDDGDEYARLIYYAMAYQIAKEIGAISAVLKGQVDAILLTGGIAYDDMFTGWIKEMISFIAPVHTYPGEDELKALAEGGLRILRGEEEAKIYGEGEIEYAI